MSLISGNFFCCFLLPITITTCYHNHTMKQLIATLLSLSIFLSSCVTPIPEIKPKVFAYFDARNKTMAVPPKPSGFCSEFKERLREHGWRIKVSSFDDQLADRDQLSKSSARYTLILREKVRAGFNESNYEPIAQTSKLANTFAMIVFFPLIPLVIYGQQQQRAIKNAEKKGIRVVHETALEEVSATIIDNRTGDEVMTFFAREVLPKLDAKTFADTIAENTK